MSTASTYTYKEKPNISPYAPHTFAADYALDHARRSSTSHKEPSAQTIYLEQIRFLTNRVKELEREKDEISTNTKTSTIKEYERGFHDGYDHFKGDLVKIKNAFKQSTELSTKQKDKIKSLQSHLHKAHNEIRQLKDSNNKIQTELALCKTNNIYERDNNIKSLMKQNEDLKKEIRSLKDENEKNNYYLLMDTQEKESQSINTINQLQSLLQDKDDELQRNDEVVRNMNRQIESLKDQNDSLIQQITMVQKQTELTEKYKSDFDDTKYEIKQKKDEIKQKKEEIKKLTDALIDSQEHFDKLRKDFEQLQHENMNLMNEIKIMREDAEAIRAKMELYETQSSVEVEKQYKMKMELLKNDYEMKIRKMENKIMKLETILSTQSNNTFDMSSSLPSSPYRLY